jgi:hypothetical protein
MTDTGADINAAVAEVEAFVTTYVGAGGLGAKELQVRPSGDDADVIKVWVDLGAAGAGVDVHAWGAACEAAIRAAVPSATAFRLQVRVETGASGA